MKKTDMKTGYALFSVIFTDENKACDKIIKEFDNKYGIYPDLCGAYGEKLAGYDADAKIYHIEL